MRCVNDLANGLTDVSEPSVTKLGLTPTVHFIRLAHEAPSTTILRSFAFMVHRTTFTGALVSTHTRAGIGPGTL